MTVEQIEAFAKASKKTEHEIELGNLLCVWSGDFEYFAYGPAGALHELTREEFAARLAAQEARGDN